MRPPSGGAGSHSRGRCLVSIGSRSGGVILARIADPGSAAQGGGGLRWGILSRPDRPSRRTRLKLQEFHARQLLRASGLPVPAWSVATTPQEVGEAAVRYLAGGAERVVVKAQVLVAPAADIVHEYYLGAVIDRAARRILLMGSAAGGVEIEEVARTDPAAVVRVHAHPHLGLLEYQARQMAFALGLGALLAEAVAIARGLVATMVANDADLVEVNPLAIVRERASDGTETLSLQ